MRIERIHIDGFGRLANAYWELPTGLTVFLGENEAGKSTLLNAIRALLFGFESTRNGRVWYPALAGGRRGGSLTLLDRDGGRWVVERHGEGGGTGSLAVRAPTGNQGGTETLDRLMHGADRELFRSIFAFGLTELSDLSSLSGDGVRGRIYGAATGLGGASAVDLEADLRERAEELFKPSGHKPALNALFARMDDLRDRIATLARAPEEHAAAHRERAEAAASADALRADADALRARVIRLQRSRSAAPLIAELEDAEARLAATDPVLDGFPTDAAVDADALAAARDAARTRRADLERSIAELDVDLAAITVDEPLLAAAAELRALDADRSALAGDEARRADAEAAAARDIATIDDQLARTRLADEPTLLGLDDSIPATDALGRREAALDESTNALADVERRLAVLRDDIAGRESPIDAEPAVDVDDAATALREITMRRSAGNRAIPATLRRPGAALATAAATIAIAVLLGQLAGALLAGLAVGVLVAGLLFALLRAAPAETIDPALLARVGLPPDATDEDVERRRDELAVERIRRQQEAAGRSASAALRARLAAEEAARSVAATARDEAAAAWDGWLRTAGLPAATTPAVARQMLAAASVARRAADGRRDQLAIVAAVRARAAAFDARATELLDRLSIAVGASPAGRLHAALDRLETAARADERRREIVGRRAKLSTQCGPLDASLATAEAAVTSHLARVGAADLADVHARSAAAEARRAMASEVRELHARLATLAGSQPVVDELRSEGRTLDLASVEGELAATSARLRDIEDAEREAHARIGELNGRIRALEASDELGSARQELAALEGQARSQARQWATTALAARLLAETRRRYERERQPDVVKAAQAYFRRITNGRYERITTPAGDGSIRVETDSGDQLLPAELSRGTVEQLYLALRFGLIEEFARRAEPLPVVMDDILVNFDEARAERAAAAIGRLAESHQVVFFTCRRETAAALDPSGERTRALG